MKTRKIPLRMCSGCGEMKPKIGLIRIVRSPDGDVSLDFVGKMPGRGAYLCRNADCLKKAVKSGRISRALSVNIPDDIYIKLEGELNKAE